MIIFTDSTEILFSKLRYAGLNYHLPKVSFLFFLYVRGGGGVGGSNKHCLLTFFMPYDKTHSIPHTRMSPGCDPGHAPTISLHKWSYIPETI